MGNRPTCRFEGVNGNLQFYKSDDVGVQTTTYSVAIKKWFNLSKVFIAQQILSYCSWTDTELFRLWYKFSAKWTACKTLVNGWTQPPLSSNTNMMLFLLYLQMSNTAAVFSPNGNEDAMNFCS